MRPTERNWILEAIGRSKKGKDLLRDWVSLRSWLWSKLELLQLKTRQSISVNEQEEVRQFQWALRPFVYVLFLIPQKDTYYGIFLAMILSPDFAKTTYQAGNRQASTARGIFRLVCGKSEDMHYGPTKGRELENSGLTTNTVWIPASSRLLNGKLIRGSLPIGRRALGVPIIQTALLTSISNLEFLVIRENALLACSDQQESLALD